MYINSKKIIQIMEQMAPCDLAESWDNVGFLLGDENRQIYKIMVALEVTAEVLEEAIEESVDLIITHHPLFFNSVKSLTMNTSLGKKVHALILHKISVYSAHTNLDIADGGTNDIFAQMMGLKDVIGLHRTGEDNYLGRIGYLDNKVSLRQLSLNLSQSLDTDVLRIVGDANKEIRKVGFCTGAGIEFAQDALDNGCDVYITGDIKYHQAQDIKEQGLCLIDVGHFPSENLFIMPMVNRLRSICEQKDYDVEIIRATTATDPFVNGLK